MPSLYTAPNGKDSRGNPRFKPDKGKFLYNVDTFWFNVDAINYDQVMDDGLRDRFIEAREAFYDDDAAAALEISLRQYENPLVFEIQGGQRPLYQYSIRNDDIAVYFSKKSRVDGQFPMKVQLNQFILWEKGIEAAYLEAIQLLCALGFGVTSSKLNRIDYAVHSDQWQWNLKDLEKMSYPRNIADDNKPNFWRLDPSTGEFETVTYGDRTRVQLRIYDKSKEVHKKGKQYFLDMYEKFGMDPEKVWNVEIEVRRDFIKECKDLDGVGLFDDLEKVFNNGGLDVLWSYLMEMYNHPSKFWTILAEGQERKFQQLREFELLREKDIDANFEREVAQIAGRLMLGVIGEENYTLDAAMKKFKEKYLEIEVGIKDKDWIKGVNKKKKKIHSHMINKTVRNNKKSISHTMKEMPELPY